MPKFVMPTVAEFAFFRAELRRINFKETPVREIRKEVERIGFEMRWPKSDQEVGFTYYENGLTVRVWTSWLEAEGRARDRDEDSGWILICQDGKLRYAREPFHRTKNFLRNLAFWAWIGQTRAINRPPCPKCTLLFPDGKRPFMDIATGPQNPRCRYWRCDRLERHEEGKYVRADWDIGLSPEQKAALAPHRRKRERQYELCRAQGKEPCAALLARKSWELRHGIFQ